MTPRDAEIMARMAQGETLSAISRALRLPEATVRKAYHRRRAGARTYARRAHPRRPVSTAPKAMSHNEIASRINELERLVRLTA